jgi:hypothetical protein
MSADHQIEVCRHRIRGQSRLLQCLLQLQSSIERRKTADAARQYATL